MAHLKMSITERLLEEHELLELTGRPKTTGDYWVRHGGGRYSVLHIPTSYTDETPLPVLCLLHGAHEDDPDDPVAWALRKTKMNEYADKYNFIIVYPIAQPLYALDGKWFYAWNSRLGTLREFDTEFQDDHDFIQEVHGWILSNTAADRNNFNIGGFSEGALMAGNIAQAGQIKPPPNCAILIAGTMLAGQEHRHPGKNAPKNVLIQINMLDTTLPPENPDSSFTPGTRFDYALSIGYVHMDKSRPLLQERFWLRELDGTGDPWCEQDVSANHVYESKVCVIRQVNRRRNLTIHFVNGGHAWHGSADGGSQLKRTAPVMNFPLGEVIAQYMLTQKPC